jgi:acetylornithine/succinyldiaminopimelate/putrescine aminotransferase
LELNQLLAAKRDFLVPCVYHFYQRPPVLVRGAGAYLYDANGRRYLDWYSGVSVMNAVTATRTFLRPPSNSSGACNTPRPFT